MNNLTGIPINVNRQLKHFHTFESYDRWIDCPGVLSFARTSPRLESAKFSHDAQRNELREAVYRFAGRDPEFHVDEIGVTGHRINSKDRTGLSHLVAIAFETGFPIVAWDWTRFARDPALLLKLDKWGVDFVCLKSLSMPLAELHGLRIRSALQEKHRQEQLGAGDRELGKFLSREFIYKPM